MISSSNLKLGPFEFLEASDHTIVWPKLYMTVQYWRQLSGAFEIDLKPKYSMRSETIFEE